MTDQPTSVVAALLRRAEDAPDAPCLAFEGQAIAYAPMRRRAEAFAAALGAWGLRRGQRVALYLENSPDFLAAFLGAHLAGGAVVLVNTQYRQTELRHILHDSGARLCFTEPHLRDEIDRVRGDVPALAQVVERGAALDGFLAGAAAPLPPPPGPEELAVIAYTSGTTGRSKGAMLLHRNLASNLQAVCAAWRWTAADHLLLALPLFHVHGLIVGACGTLVAGASMDLRRRFDAAEVYQALLRPGARPATVFFGVPTMYTRLLAEAQRHAERPAPLRLYVSGSAALSPQTFADFERAFGQRILERYGMSETLMNLTNPYDGERRPGTVGQPFPGQEARIVDLRTRQPLPPDSDGEIEVRGPHVFAGYWGRPDASAESFDADGWFRTGDLGRVSRDGYVSITGRAKELIISGGYNVYPREVEEVLAACPGVAEVAVFGLPDPEYGERVAAAVVRSDPALTTEALEAFCRERLASYKKPRQVVFVGELPRNALGKVQKHALQAALAAGAGGA